MFPVVNYILKEVVALQRCYYGKHIIAVCEALKNRKRITSNLNCMSEIFDDEHFDSATRQALERFDRKVEKLMERNLALAR